VLHTHHFFHNVQCILSITSVCEYSVFYKHLLHRFTVQTDKLTTVVTRNLRFSPLQVIHAK